jgi:hypothetical protein
VDSLKIMQEWKLGLRPESIEIGIRSHISSWTVVRRRALWDYGVHPKSFKNRISRIWASTAG